MRDALEEAQPTIQAAYQQLKSILQKMHRAKSAVLDKMWADHRARRIPSAPGARRTFVRRGLSKTLIFEDLSKAVDIFDGGGTIWEECPKYASLLGLVSEVTHGKTTVVKPADSEIVNAIRTLGNADALAVLSSFDRRKVDHWLQSIRNVDHYVAMAEFAANNLATIKDAVKLEGCLKKLHAEPDSLTKIIPTVPKSGWPPDSVWLLEYCIELAKMVGGNSTSYGYAQLAKDVAEINGPAGGLSRQAREFLLSPWGHLSEWIHRVPDKDLPKGVLSGVCRVLADKFIKITARDILSSTHDFAKVTANGVIQTKLCCYRGFDPLAFLIESYLPQVKQIRAPSCYVMRAGLAGQAGKNNSF